MSDLIQELAAGGAAALDVQLDDGVVPRLLAYSRSVAGFPTAVKEVSLLTCGIFRVLKWPFGRGNCCACMVLCGCASLPTSCRSVQFEWRNGWFYEQSKEAMNAGKPDPYPKHTAALKEVGAI